MFKKLLTKKFTDSKKIEEAKKKAMEMYEKMRKEEKISLNRELEKSLLEKQKKDNTNKLEDINEYKNEKTKQTIEELFDKFNYVEKEEIRDDKESKKEINRKEREESLNVRLGLRNQKLMFNNNSNPINLNYYNKIEGEVLLYKLNDYFKNNIDKENWVKVYEAKYDPSYEKFKNFFLNLLKVIIFYKTLFYIKKFIWKNNESSESIKLKIEELKKEESNSNSKLNSFFLLFDSWGIINKISSKSTNNNYNSTNEELVLSENEIIFKYIKNDYEIIDEDENTNQFPLEIQGEENKENIGKKIEMLRNSDLNIN